MYREVVLAASATRSSSGTDELKSSFHPQDLAPDTEKARCYLNVSAASGITPTLDVKIVAEINSVEYELASFTQKTTTGKETIVIDICPKNLRAKWTIGGTTPNFTFEVSCSRA